MGVSLPSHVPHGSRHVPNGDGRMTKNNNRSWTRIVRPQNLALRVFLALFLFAFTGLRTVAAQTAAKPPDPVNKWPKPVMDNEVIAHMLLDQFEGRASADGSQF